MTQIVQFTDLLQARRPELDNLDLDHDDPPDTVSVTPSAREQLAELGTTYPGQEEHPAVVSYPTLEEYPLVPSLGGLSNISVDSPEMSSVSHLSNWLKPELVNNEYGKSIACYLLITIKS